MGREDESGGILSPSIEWRKMVGDVAGGKGTSCSVLAGDELGREEPACRSFPRPGLPLRVESAAESFQAGFMLKTANCVAARRVLRTELSVSQLLVGTV